MTLTSYIKAAMKQAQFERLRDNSIYGHIPDFEGVWAQAKTQAACRRELQEVLEDWMLFRLKHDLPLPVVADLDLNQIAA
ncbi:type II toxin-antitoxin system HicB family antitoxin [Candidatus Acetothermia bacterium]|nr:type II toxin-antitoxin system HicB family antitoxin [Candidatus Acetothermia bacterium]MBI3660707.1 type II toxin-antitoxin system HicB family antitoxin [Candidatus Acetothermia bacterium]